MNKRPYLNKLLSPQISKEYRPELNGLRALAVMLVLLYHLDFEWMKGGFLGVDIFLVISGYFISRNIIYELQQGKFTFYGFYTKRLRRLFPALIFTLILVLVAGYYLLTPSNLERLGKSTIYSSLSFSNFFFWSESGYFDLGANLKPLLHMWSLSLEEQFYLFWPLLLFLLYRYFKRHILLFILLFIIGSIFLSEWYFSTDQSAVFFLIPFRMFEFLLGASCIWLERVYIKRSNFLQEILFLVGLLLIIFSAFYFSNETKMPGLLSLIPCLGAVLIIYGGRANKLSWILKNKTVELIGKSSYSIYLIHWPLVVYYSYWTLSSFNLATQIILGLISILLGVLMWYFIENTFRYAKNIDTKLDRVWVAIPVSLLLINLLSANVLRSNGFPDRFPGELYMSKEEILENRKSYWKESNSKSTILKGETGKGKIIMFGNSQAIDLIYALRNNGFEAKIISLQTAGKCFNFSQPIKEIDADLCAKKKEANLNNNNWENADAIYLHDHWPQLDLIGLRKILKNIRELSNAPVFVFGPKLIYDHHIPEIARTSHSLNPKVINNYAKKYSKIELKTDINDKLKDEFRDPFYTENNIIYIDILSLQGGDNLDEFEIVSKDLKFLYFDRGHFTEQGSKELGEKIKVAHPYLFDIESLKKKLKTAN